VPPQQLLLFVFLLALFMALVQLGAITVAFQKLGLSSQSAFTLLFASLLGSAVNLPVTKVKATRPENLDEVPEPMRPLVEEALRRFKGETQLAVNVGGGLVPVMFSYYLMRHHPLPLGEVLMGIAIVALVCYYASRPMPGLGIGIPIFVPPIAAALTAWGLDPDHSAPLAYICGTLGVLLGADLMRLGDIRRMGAPMASIGGAGTFDGIFVTGIVAVLLA